MNASETSKVIGALVCMAQMSAKDGNVFPQPACGRNGDSLDVIAFALNPNEIFKAVKEIVKSEKYEEFAFGLDRKSLPNQGVDEKYTDVYTIFHRLGDGMWTYGVFPYNDKGEYGEVDWGNAHWTHQMDNERLRLNII